MRDVQSASRAANAAPRLCYAATSFNSLSLDSAAS
jgi:hypothetical protein